MVRQQRQAAGARSPYAGVIALLLVGYALVWSSSAAADPTAEPDDEHVALVKRYFRVTNPTKRAALAAKLETELGAAATRRALEVATAKRRVRPGIRRRHATAAKVRAPYAVFVPKGYDPSRPWPVHISLHGGGKRGGWHNCRYHWGRKPQADFLLVCPTTPAGKWWKPEGDAMLAAVYRKVVEEFRVDTDRVSIGGISNGGTGTWHLAIKYPWLWSALVPRCAASIRAQSLNRNMAHIPAFIIHGDKDRLIDVEHSQTMVELLQELGGDTVYREVEGGGHKFFPDLNAEVRPWMLEKVRKTPSSFVYRAIHGNPTPLVYWLGTKGHPGTVSATITATEGETRVELTTEESVEELRVFLPSEHVDLSKEVSVLLNGKERYRGKVGARARDVLESYGFSRDLKRTFNASVTIRPGR